MQFKRQISYYVVTIYVPTFMIVCVSWMSFWLDHKSAPARVALTITTLLAMATTTASINSSMPPVAYTKVITVSRWFCLIFLFQKLRNLFVRQTKQMILILCLTSVSCSKILAKLIVFSLQIIFLFQGH